jgi:hypothetical protein
MASSSIIQMHLLLYIKDKNLNIYLMYINIIKTPIFFLGQTTFFPFDVHVTVHH